MIKKIAIEEHFRPKCYHDYLLSRKEPPRLEVTRNENGQKLYHDYRFTGECNTRTAETYNKIMDVSEGRLEVMDEVGIDMQVLSFSAVGFEWHEQGEAQMLTRKINDELSSVIGKHPDKFAGMATLSLSDPLASANELERAIKQLGLKGAMISPHSMGEYIDARKYWPVFEKGAELGVPFYLHPTCPPPDNQHLYAGYPELSEAMWGFAAETGLAAMRLICSGVFDAYPDLKIILGHMGEALPFWMSRLDDRMEAMLDIAQRDEDGELTSIPLVKLLKKLPSDYIRDNFFITTSGVMWVPPLLCSLLALGSERILFATDYPFESASEAVRFLETAPISKGDKEKISYLNAESLFNL